MIYHLKQQNLMLILYPFLTLKSSSIENAVLSDNRKLAEKTLVYKKNNWTTRQLTGLSVFYQHFKIFQRSLYYQIYKDIDDTLSQYKLVTVTAHNIC